MKTCSVCNLLYSLDFFPKTGKNYTSSKCKSCTASYKRQHKNKQNPFVESNCAQCDDKFRHRKLSKSTICRPCRSFNNTQTVRSINECHTCGKLFEAIYTKTKFCGKACFDIRPSRAEEFRVWYSNNKNNRVEYHRNKYNNDINFRLSDVLRSRVRKAVKNNQKTGSAVDNLGCSIEELKKHLESKFTEGMSWDNYGEWHIDHIKPLSKFDLTDSNQLREACNYINLQPLWAKDNLRKSNRRASNYISYNG